MNDVTWRTHPLYEFYEVSSDGRVRSVDRIVTMSNGVRRFHPGRELSTHLTRRGYFCGSISVEGKEHKFYPHRFVCQAFHGVAASDDLEVRHLNGIATDNRVENLMWGTRSENRQDCVRHGTHSEARKTHCPQGHEYTEENIYRRPGRRNSRSCRTCGRSRSHKKAA